MPEKEQQVESDLSPVIEEYLKTEVDQELIESLREEFLSSGGIVTKLPDIEEVRDFTIVVIMSKDADGKDVANLYMMIVGKWFSLNEYQVVATGALGGADQFDTGTAVAFSGANIVTEITSGWTVGELQNMLFSSGVFTIQRAGNYKYLSTLCQTDKVKLGIYGNNAGNDKKD